jgi:hypothetical protein
MRSDFIPSRESELVTFAENFASYITATTAANYGLTADQATTFDRIKDEFIVAYNTSQNRATRSPSNIILKDTAKKTLVENIRQLARIINAFPGTTNVMRSNLGLTVRDAEPTPIPAPTTPPVIEIRSVFGRTLNVKLGEFDSDRRGKPAGVQHAIVMKYVGNEAPTATEQWTFVGNMTRTTFDVVFDSDLPAGTKVWITACWQNYRGESGPYGFPQTVTFGAATVGMPKAA